MSLTYEIAEAYREKAMSIGSDAQDIGTRRELRIQLQRECGVTEIEAINILNGRNVGDYVLKYQRGNLDNNYTQGVREKKQAWYKQLEEEARMYDRIRELQMIEEND